MESHGATDEELAEIATLANEQAYQQFTEAKAFASQRDEKNKLAKAQFQHNAKVAALFTAAGVTGAVIGAEQTAEKAATLVQGIFKSTTSGIGKRLAKISKGFGEYIDDMAELVRNGRPCRESCYYFCYYFCFYWLTIFFHFLPFYIECLLLMCVTGFRL